MGSYVGKITDTNGVTAPIGSTLYGTCDTAAGTADKVVTCPAFDTLIEGVTVFIKFTNSNTSTDTITLNINGTGKKNMYRYGTTKPGTYTGGSWMAGAIVSVTYSGGAWIMNDWLCNDNTYDRTSVQTRIYAGATGVFPYCICALDNVGRVQAMTTTGGTGTSKAFNSSQKFVFPPVLFYNAENSTKANGSVITNNVLYEQYPTVDMRYSCNITTESGFTQYKPIYIECAFNADGTWSPSGITQTFTAGRYYILLGGTYNTSIYQLALWAQHPAFYAISSTEIIPYQNEHRTALVYDNSEDSTSYPWHKFASITITTAYVDTSISFIVSLTYGSVPKSLGILTAHVRTGSTKVKEAAEFEWTLAGNNVDPSLFTMVYTDTANTSCAVELYCKPNSRYTGLSFTVLQEESRESVSTKWNLVRYAASAHGIATLPTGTGQVVSSLITIAATGVGLYNSTFKNILQSATLTAAATQTFPATGGTVLNTGTTSVSTSTVSGATTIKSIKLNGTNYNIYDSTYTAGNHLTLSSSNEFRITDYCTTITDWNSAKTNGWYMGASVTNAPSTAWWFGRVIAHNDKYCLQEAWQFTASTDAHSVPHKLRMFMNNTWGSWVDCTIGTAVPTNAVFTDTKNTAGSTDTSSKIFLIGATSQAANPQTYSDNEVYVTSGALTTKTTSVGGGKCTMQYNTTTESLDFVFT